MNSASRDFPHHLAELRERMLHPTDYEKAVHYFLEEFAGDQAFVRASDVDSMAGGEGVEDPQTRQRALS